MEPKIPEEEPIKVGVWKKFWQWVASLAGVLGIFIGVVKNSQTVLAALIHVLSVVDGWLFKGQIKSLLLNRPDWLLNRLGLLFLITTLVMAFMILAWRHRTLSLYLKLIAAAVVSFLLSIVAIGLTAGGPYWHGRANTTAEVAVVCPQCVQLGTCALRTYANNGKAHYSIDANGEPRGPRGHAKVALQAYRPDEEHGSGWVIFLPRGSDLSAFKQLRFWIRGERGGERIGVKVKDAQGVEVPVVVNDRYILGATGIAADWREVSIPFEDFPLVNFGLMDNFSIYVNGRIAGTEPQTIYIGGLEWR